MAEWRIITCPACDGHGMVSVYTIGGTDFDGAGECDDCNGTGNVYVSSRDRLAKWLGGPFLGTWPGRYALGEHDE